MSKITYGAHLAAGLLFGDELQNAEFRGSEVPQAGRFFVERIAAGRTVDQVAVIKATIGESSCRSGNTL
jgi:hypothetical protein